MNNAVFLTHKNFFEKNNKDLYFNKFFQSEINNKTDIQLIYGNDKLSIKDYAHKTSFIFQNLNILIIFKAIFFIKSKDIDLLKYIVELYSYKPLRMKLDNSLTYHNYFFLVLRVFFKSRYSYFFFKENYKSFNFLYLNVYYNSVSLGALRAFNELDKKTIEFQHGYIGVSHNAYSSKIFLNKKYKDFLPKKIIVWNQKFQSYVEKKLKTKSSITKFIYKPNKIKRDSNFKCRVLYTLDWGADIPEIVIRLMLSTKSVEWILRRHPRSTKLFFQNKAIIKIKSSGAQNIFFSDPKIPIEDELFNCDFHFTFESSTIHEAANLKIKSYFFSKKHIDRFKDEIKMNMATYIEEKKIFDQISKILNKI